MRQTTLRWGILLGVAGVVLTVLGPLIIGNFGTTYPVEGAPIALTVSIVYSTAVAALLPFSAALVAASLIMRNAEALASNNGVQGS